MRLTPEVLGSTVPGDLREMLDAVLEEESVTREWIAGLIAQVVMYLSPNKIKKKLDASDFLSKADRVRAAKRYRQRVALEQASTEQTTDAKARAAAAFWGETP